jgi:hypothetical protein
MKKCASFAAVAVLAMVAGSSFAAAAEPGGLEIVNGWFTQDGRVIWGAGQHNGWWGGYRRTESWIRSYKVRTALCRRDPNRVGPSFTEDLDQVTDAMVRSGYPGFEHNYGLWFDRRRDNHDLEKRSDDRVQPPFLEQPWARSGQGTAWDGLSRYDLTRFNPWYFGRLKEFATLSRAKGCILFHNFYMQHALLEQQAHYVDFPWRPANCVQETDMPDSFPAANAFYDVTNERRRELHRLYIRKCLDELGGQSNVVHLVSEEYTGPLSFVQFWIDTVLEWQRQTGKHVQIGLVGTKDVIDAVLADPARGPHVSVLCLSYWWYNADGSLHAPEGGREIAGRYTGELPGATSPASLYRQIREYRLRYPDKAIIQHHRIEVEKAWAFLMGGGSMIFSGMQYRDSAAPKESWEPPETYVAPEESAAIQPTYDFLRRRLATSLSRMKPSAAAGDGDRCWRLAEEGRQYLVFALRGGPISVDLSAAPGERFNARWFDPRSGAVTPAGDGVVSGGSTVSFASPDDRCRALWLSVAEP